MSTSLVVVPSSPVVPTTGELAVRMGELLCGAVDRPVIVQAFVGLDLKRRPLVEVIRPQGTGAPRRADASLPLAIPADEYGWISLPGGGVGFDFTFDDDDPAVRHDWVSEECAARATELGTAPGFPFDRAAGIGHSWTLRLQAMQPVVVHLLAGFAAVALGQLVDGFIHSEDGGPDELRTPATPQRFLDWYPEWIAADRAWVDPRRGRDS